MSLSYCITYKAIVVIRDVRGGESGDGDEGGGGEGAAAAAAAAAAVAMVAVGRRLWRRAVTPSNLIHCRLRYLTFIDCSFDYSLEIIFRNLKKNIVSLQATFLYK